jgi:hypothetical protein
MATVFPVPVGDSNRAPVLSSQALKIYSFFSANTVVVVKQCRDYLGNDLLLTLVWLQGQQNLENE